MDEKPIINESVEKENENNTELEPNVFSNIMENFGFYHVNPDSDGFYNGLVVPKPQANYLFYTSFFSLISTLYGLYKKEYLNTIGVFSIFITSINYWRDPVYGWRRNIDIVASILGLSLNSINSYNHPRRGSLNRMLLCCLLFYPLGYYFQNKSLHLSTFFHSLIHILGNMICISYYSDNNNGLLISNDVSNVEL
jgi:hypothetical protein